MVVRSHALEIYASAGSPVTVSFGTGDTLYYKADPSVSTISSDGTLTANQSVVISAPTWVVSAGRSYIATTEASVSHGLTPFAQSVLAAGSASAARSVLDAQQHDTDLDSIAAVSTASFGRGLLAESSATTARSTLGTGDVDNATVTASSSAISATTFTVRSSTPPSTGLVAIDVGSVNCEVRRISSVSGSTVTVNTALLKAHSSGVKVYFFNSSADPAWWGAKGDDTTGNTDDEPALQAALRSISEGGLINQSGSSLPLSGGGRSYMIAKPLLLPNQTSLERLSIKARSNYAPVDSLGAMLIGYRSTVVTFTATASDNVFTTSAAHSQGTGANGCVCFKGPNLPAGLVAGKVYYVETTPTTTTFTLYADGASGAQLDITTDGSGDCYPTLQGGVRMYFRGVRVAGLGSTGGVNGIRLSLQQPASFYDVRVELCRWGLWLNGQQAPFYNTQTLQCDVGIALDNAQFFWFYGLNCEQSTTANVMGVSIADGAAPGKGTIVQACGFYGVHFEITATEWCFDFRVITTGISIDQVHLTGAHLLWSHNGTLAATNSGYRITNLRRIEGPGDAIQPLIQDDDRGYIRNTKLHKEYPPDILMPTALQSLGDDVDSHEISIPPDGYIRHGGTSPDSNMMEMRAQTGHTATKKQILWKDHSGNPGSWISTSGYVGTTHNAAPADGELSANEAAVWFDSTNGAAKINWKAKQADGTVKTGTLPLFTAADTTAQSTTASTQTTPWGFASQAQADAIATHLNDIRTCLRNAGLMA